MTDAYFTNPLIFLVKTLFGLYITVVVIRFLLQWARADFYNPISQFVVKVTSPALRPLRKFIPGYGGIDLSALVLAWLLKALELALLSLLLGYGHFVAALAWAIPALLGLFISIFLFAILVRVILSWVNPDPYNPAIELLNRLTDPILIPAQRMIPPISGIDLSPMLAMIGLVLTDMLLLPPLRWLTGSPF
ncbi:MAG TPA: YggT family protein [Chromatiaceae bacterium]|jgi:YggT family protein|nr:MAG: membrane protein [Thiohalocapsa sp. PB-PSB1]QQO55654.1 MAG: YggT family protein [Thiohalocapsa sp. PB-PSB1]HBG95152.1 YggT family protein [Chromatiaceae bacterium]HCS93031.1 YggT family protein [Chromatiaceae bacterium]